METFLLYIIKSTLCLALFYICFKALFSNDTFFRLNRWLLLLGMGICLLLPVVRTETKNILLIQQPILRLEKIITDETNQQPFFYEKKAEVPYPTAALSGRNNFWIKIMGIVYLGGCFVYLAISLVSFCAMYRIIRSGRRECYEDYMLVLIPRTISPFSWGRYIVLSEEDFRNHRAEIFTHEKIHLTCRHSIDLIFMEMIIILHWFNPAVWLLKRELKDIHEYQADRGVLNLGIDATKYQLLLVKKAVGSSCYTLANSFNHSKIKKRITMMLKEKSNNWTRLKLLLLVPAGLLTLQAFAHPELVVKPFATLNASVLPVMSSKSTTILQNDQKKKSEYYLVDNQGMTNGEYDEFVKKKVARTSVNREGLTNAKGKIVKVVGFWKGDKGYVSFPAIYLELKEGVKMEYKNNMPPPPPPPPLGTVKVYYKDVDKPTSFFINVGDTEIDFQKELDIVYNDNIIKVCIIPDSKEIAERFNEFEAVNKVLKNKVADKVQIGELEAEK